MVTDLVSLIRFALEHETVLAPFAETVDDRFQRWLSEQGSARFSTEQVEWLTMIKDHIAASLSIDAEAFDYKPFQQKGGLGKAFLVFGEEFSGLLKELNEVLAA